jgi:hypothetical protein
VTAGSPATGAGAQRAADRRVAARIGSECFIKDLLV